MSFTSFHLLSAPFIQPYLFYFVLRVLNSCFHWPVPQFEDQLKYVCYFLYQTFVRSLNFDLPERGRVSRRLEGSVGIWESFSSPNL